MQLERQSKVQRHIVRKGENEEAKEEEKQEGEAAEERGIEGKVQKKRRRYKKMNCIIKS